MLQFSVIDLYCHVLYVVTLSLKIVFTWLSKYWNHSKWVFAATFVPWSNLSCVLAHSYLKINIRHKNLGELTHHSQNLHLRLNLNPSCFDHCHWKMKNDTTLNDYTKLHVTLSHPETLPRWVKSFGVRQIKITKGEVGTGLGRPS